MVLRHRHPFRYKIMNSLRLACPFSEKNFEAFWWIDGSFYLGLGFLPRYLLSVIVKTTVCIMWIMP